MILLIFQVYFLSWSVWSKHTLHANELRRVRTDLFAESEHELQIGMHIVSIRFVKIIKLKYQVIK